MIIKFESNSILLSNPPKYWLYYKTENELHFNKISVTYQQLKIFLKTHGYKNNNILEINKFGINTIKYKTE
jgi:hypothetical protein